MRFIYPILFLALALLLVSCWGEHRATLQKVDQLMAEKQYSQALQTLHDALQKDPDSVALLRHQVLFFLRAGEVERSVAAYRKLAAKHPNDNILIKSVKDNDEIVRISAIRTLGLLRDSSAEKTLIGLLSTDNKQARKVAIISLGDMKSEKAVSGITALLKDPDWAIRLEAAQALGKIETKDPKAISSLFELMDDTDNDVKQNAARALDNLADKSHQSIYQTQLKSSSIAKQRMAACCLAKIKDPGGLPILLAMLQENQPAKQITAIRALAQLGKKEAIPSLRQALKSPNNAVRVHAILALGVLRDQESLDILKKLASNSSEIRDVRIASNRAVQLIEGR